MKRTWWELLGIDEFHDADGSVDRACYGIFPAEDTADAVAGYFKGIGIETEKVEVVADWSRAVERDR